MVRTTTLILLIVSGVLAGIVIAWWPNLAQAIALEDSPVAWLQSSLLVACACTAGLRAIAAQENGSVPRRQVLWVGLALLMIVAALDERFMGHEHVQEFLFYDILGGDPSLKPWSLCVILLYGLAGVVALLWMRQEMSPSAWLWCRAGVAVGFVAMGLDLAFDSIGMQVVEELFETGAETLFLCGLFREAGTAVCPKR